MSRPKNNLNTKPSEYIEENFLKQNPEGLPECKAATEEGKIVVAQSIPETRWVQFVNQRDPGIPLEFHYHSKSIPLVRYTLYHGKEYCLPVEVIEHLENCGESQYGYRTGLSGHPEMYVKGKRYIFRCQPVKRVA